MARSTNSRCSDAIVYVVERTDAGTRCRRSPHQAAIGLHANSPGLLDKRQRLARRIDDGGRIPLAEKVQTTDMIFMGVRDGNLVHRGICQHPHQLRGSAGWPTVDQEAVEPVGSSPIKGTAEERRARYQTRVPSRAALRRSLPISFEAVLLETEPTGSAHAAIHPPTGALSPPYARCQSQIDP